MGSEVQSNPQSGAWAGDGVVGVLLTDEPAPPLSSSGADDYAARARTWISEREGQAGVSDEERRGDLGELRIEIFGG